MGCAALAPGRAISSHGQKRCRGNAPGLGAGEQRRLSENPELLAEMETWKESRGALIESLKEPGATSRESWQRLYFRGLDPKGQVVPHAEHQTRLKVKPFTR